MNNLFKHIVFSGGLLLAAMLSFALCACGTRGADTLTTCVLTGTVVEIHGDSMLIEPAEGSPERNSADRFSIPLANIEASPGPQIGDTVEVLYDGDILETYPAMPGKVFSVRVKAEEGVNP